MNAIVAHLKKEIRRFLRLWRQTLLPSAITTTLYFLIFGTLIGARIGHFAGVPYAQFIAPGLVMMSVINNAYNNTVSSFYSAKFHGAIEELLISPMSNGQILFGYLAGGILRGLSVGVIVTGVALFFTHIHIIHPFLAFLVLFFTASAFALGGFINAIFARGWDDIGLVPIFILVPLTYLGGVFYSVASLPEPWQFLSHLNPIFYMVNGFRYGYLGIGDVPLWHTAVCLLLLNGSLTVWALKLMNMAGKLRK